ncbi:MAG: phosphate ABC transporter ATP-binding protein [Anaerolineales bacterium]|nr:phosphate ABC transporter ATP-binding protein [Anaerolineales bacterium]MCO5244906.1 phosphate ABC transporter ATP-binding protein [Anaerolineae bacterium]
MTALSVRNLNVWYGDKHTLNDVSVEIPLRRITCIIGPSGCGKSTLLKALNRLLDLNDQVKVSGQVRLDDINIYDPGVDVTEVRTRVGLLAQKPFPLPMSIFDNVAYGPRIHGRHNGKIHALVQEQLQAVGLWDEVADRLKAPATSLSVGQQQRLCLARTLSVEPEIVLCDESTASLDPISARGIEGLLCALKDKYTVVLVTHDIDQARRLADHVIFMWLGEVVESAPAGQFFGQPKEELTQAYLAREIG